MRSVSSSLPVSASGYASVVALDWADGRHAWAQSDVAAEMPRTGWLDNTPEAIDDWARQLGLDYHGRSVAVVLEQRRGALVAQLSKYAHFVLHPVHPSSLAQYRRTFCPSGAKDDPVDARALLDLFWRHPKLCPRLESDTPETRIIQSLVEDRRRLVSERTRATNRLRDQLKRYFPQVLKWFEKIDTQVFVDLLRRWPTIERLQQVRPTTLRQFFRAHHIGNEQLIEQRLEAIRNAVPATTDEVVIQAGTLLVSHLLLLLEQIRTAIQDYDAHIERLAAKHPDIALYHSFPGAGAVLAPRLLAAMGTDRNRFATAVNLQSYSGIAPVVVRSGKQCQVRVRYACPRFVRQTFHEWAQRSIPKCDWARSYYQQQRTRGATAQAAIRALAYKWQRILFRCWKDRVPYSDSRYQTALAKHRRGKESPPTKREVKIQWKTQGGFSKPTAIFT
jgi:transposase